MLAINLVVVFLVLNNNCSLYTTDLSIQWHVSTLNWILKHQFWRKFTIKLSKVCTSNKSTTTKNTKHPNSFLHVFHLKNDFCHYSIDRTVSCLRGKGEDKKRQGRGGRDGGRDGKDKKRRTRKRKRRMQINFKGLVGRVGTYWWLWSLEVGGSWSYQQLCHHTTCKHRKGKNS